MWRTQAVRALLVEEVAAVRSRAGQGGAAKAAGHRLDADLRRATRRATLAVVVDWAAILILVLTRQGGGTLLELGPTVEAIFTLGILAVAVHSGFRLAQIEKYRTVARLCRDLDDRDPGD